MRIERHPYLNVWVREDGCVYIPQSGRHAAHWTFGCKNNLGYRLVNVAGKSYKVHRLVAETFIGEIPDGFEVDHINRVKHDNQVENLRIVTKCDNCRNRADHDRMEAQGRTHKYEDTRQFYRERHAIYHQAKCKTHRQVRFSDGSRHYIPLKEAEILLKIPQKQRIFAK